MYEAMVIVLRSVDELLVAKSMSGEELARELVLNLSISATMCECDAEGYLPQCSGHWMFLPQP